MEKTKLPIPLQSVTMSAEQYEELCDKIKTAQSYHDNFAKLMEMGAEKGLHFRGNGGNPLVEGFDEIRIDVSNLGISDVPTIQILLK